MLTMIAARLLPSPLHDAQPVLLRERERGRGGADRAIPIAKTQPHCDSMGRAFLARQRRGQGGKLLPATRGSSCSKGFQQDCCLLRLLALRRLNCNQQRTLGQSRCPPPPPPPPAPRAAYNSMPKSATPFNCQELAWPNHPHPGMKAYCEQVEARTLSSEAQRAGRPSPSSSVIGLPPLGSGASKRSGTACIGGQAFRKLPNGWEQIHAPAGGWQRCRER